MTNETVLEKILETVTSLKNDVGELKNDVKDLNEDVGHILETAVSNDDFKEFKDSVEKRFDSIDKKFTQQRDDLMKVMRGEDDKLKTVVGKLVEKRVFSSADELDIARLQPFAGAV